MGIIQVETSQGTVSVEIAGETPTQEEKTAIEKYFSSQVPITETQETTIEPRIEEIGEYSANNLLDDQFYQPIKEYMKLRFNVDEFDTSREDIVNKYLNNMRGFIGAGNSVRAVNEISFLNQFDEDNEEDAQKLSKIGEAYTIYEGMEGLFGDTTAGEKLGILGDFIRETVLDPTNLIGFGLGKVATAGGTKIAVRIAQKKAMDKFKSELAKGATKKKAQEAADVVWSESMISAGKDISQVTVKNRVRKNLARGFRGLATKDAAKEIGVNVAVETVASVGSAIAYENALVRTTDKNADYVYASGMAALGSIVVGGIQGGLATYLSRVGAKPRTKAGEKFEQTNKLLGTEDLALPDVDVVKPEKLEGIRKVSLSLRDYLKKVPESDWKSSVGDGKDLSDYGDTFIKEMLLGNDEKGLIGLFQVMDESGYQWIRRSPDDRISKFTKDVIKTADPQDVKAFLKDFEDATGINIYTSKETGDVTKLSEMTVDQFADVFARWASRTGQSQNALAQGAIKLSPKNIPKDFTKGDYVKALYDTGLAKAHSDGGKNFFQDRLGFSPSEIGLGVEGITETQNRLIRLLVSAPSTTYLNLVGWASATAINSATDIGMGLLFAGQGLAQRLVNSSNSKESLRIAGAYFRSNAQRIRNLLDPNMTYDAFRSISQKNPEQLAELVKVLPGGVEDVDKLIRMSGFNPNQTVFGAGSERFVEFAQQMSAVKLQDVFTKSQEFVYQLDKNLRIGFGKSWSEFYLDPNASKLMNSREYKTAVARASYESQRAIFSKSFKDKTVIGEIAGVVENARNIPGLGLLVPFGRFFNNTIAFSSDMTGVSAMSKLISKTGLKEDTQERGLRELFLRGSIGLATIYTLAQNEKHNREAGLAWHQRFDDETGAVIDERFNFPMSHFKAAGRLFSYLLDDSSPPPEEVADILDTIGPGQLTRQLEQSVTGVGQATQAFIAGEKSFLEAMSVSFGKIAAQAGSAATRFIDPVNSFAGLVRGSEFQVPNRKIGSENINNSLRYIDQIIGMVAGDIAPERFDSAMGDIRSDASKNLGIREVEFTDTAKLLNMIGMPNYLANERTKNAIAGNRFNQVFHDVVENLASEELKSKYFRDTPPAFFTENRNVTMQDYRKVRVKSILKEAKEITRFLMDTGAENIEDIKFRKMLAMEKKYSMKTIDKVMDDMKDKLGDIKFEDLNFNQLLILDSRLEYEKFINKIYN